VTFRRLASLGTILVLAGGIAPSQQPNAVPDSGAVIRTETKVVLVDTVVTDKKGNYVRNLTAKDFKVWEDNKEQAVKSFSFQSDPSAPGGAQRRYIVLFFDNSTMPPGAQAQARQAAANAGSLSRERGREESPDSIVVNSKEPSTKGNAPGNARGWRDGLAHGRFGCAATESATENKPPVLRKRLWGKFTEKPWTRHFGRAHWQG